MFTAALFVEVPKIRNNPNCYQQASGPKNSGILIMKYYSAIKGMTYLYKIYVLIILSERSQKQSYTFYHSIYIQPR